MNTDDERICPIFSCDADDSARLKKLRTVRTITIRKNKNGQWITLAIRLNPDEIESEEQLARIVGAGYFEVIGLDESNRIAAKQRISFEETPGITPENDDETQEGENKREKAQVVATSVDMSQPTSIYALLLQNQQEATRLQMNMMFQMGKSQSDMLAAIIPAIIGAKQGDSGLAQIVSKLIEHKNEGNPQNVFTEGVKFATDLVAGKREAEAAAAAASQGLSIEQIWNMVKEGAMMYQSLVSSGTISNEEALRQVAQKTGLPLEGQS